MRRKQWTSALTAASLAVGLAPALGAATGAQLDAGTRMNQLGVVQGSGTLPNGQPDLNLDGQITRAELITTIVRSFGLETAAQASKGIASFADVPAGQWYSGYVAVANNLAKSKGIAIGRSESVFDPNASVTKAEALVFVLKFLGLNATGAGTAWYDPWLDLATTQGVMTPAQRAEALQNAALSATRGEAFVILDLGYRAKVLPGGLSLYTQFVDSLAPAITLVSLPPTTTEATVTVTGTVSDNKAVTSASVNGNLVTLTGGRFSTTIQLAPGPNSIVVEATDLAGNSQRETLVVTRGATDAASIQAADLTVGAGQSINAGVVVKDAAGTAIPGVVVAGTSTLGTFANGQFTAGSALGSGKLTLKAAGLTKEINVNVVAGPVAKILAASVGPGGSAKLQATDAFGNAVTSGITWSLAPNQSGAAVAADGTFTGLIAGNYIVLASANGTSTMGQVGVYGMVNRLRVEAPANVVGNGKTEYTVKVYGVDANGFVTTNFAAPVSLDTPFGDVLSATAKDGMATFTFTASDAYIGEQAELKATSTLDGRALEGSTTVQVTAQEAASIRVQPAAAFLTSNATSTLLDVAVQVLDQHGAPMLDGDFPLTLTVTGPATFDNGTTTKEFDWTPFVDGVQIRPTEIGVTGTITVVATGAGLTAGQGQVSARMAGTPRLIALKASGTKMAAQTGTSLSKALYFQAFLTDANGVPVTPDDKDLKVVFTGIPTADLEKQMIAFDLNGNGLLDGGEGFDPLDTADLTQTSVTDGTLAFWLVGKQAGSFGVSVADASTSPTLTASPAISYSVTSGQVHHFVGLHPQALLVQRGLPTTLRYQAVDDVGNPVAQANLQLVFDATGNSGLKLNGQTTAVKAVTDATGIATVTLVANTVITTSGGVPLSLNPGATNIANGWSGTATEWDTAVSSLIVAPGSVETSLEVDNGSGWTPLVGGLTAGMPIRVVASVKDTQGYLLPGVGSTIPAELVVKSTGTTQTNLSSVTFSDPDNDGVYQSSSIVITKAGVQTLRAELSNLPQPVTNTGKNVNVRAGALDGLKITEATNAQIKLKSNQAKELTIQLVDSWGNSVAGSGVPHAVKITFDHTAGGAGYTSFRDQNGTELITSGITISAGRTGAQFFLLSNLLSGNSVTIFATVDEDNSGTFDGSDPVYSVTYDLIAE
jgi:hypothetical protein